MWNFNILASLYIWIGWFEVYAVDNPEDTFSHVIDQMCS